MHERECPNCLYSGGIVWNNPRITIALGDHKVSAFWLTNLPDDNDITCCYMCGYEGMFSEWGPHEELSEPPEELFTGGDVVCCLRRKKGTGRDHVEDLVKFIAKEGVDGTVRWCIIKPALVEKVPSSSVARQLARFLGLRFLESSLNHRQVTKTRASLAQSAMTSI